MRSPPPRSRSVPEWTCGRHVDTMCGAASTVWRGAARRVGWDDLVLPPGQLEQLHALVAAARNRAVLDEWGFGDRHSRGLGTTALFAGPSGTGKTLAAEVIAHELGVDLFHVDLSQVVSKYIGETEKNLRRVFDAAEDGGAVLLFDEADALFGKRTEVTDSHDRYANLEVGYLLQRMEPFRGLAILTTNARTVLDKAFLRRIQTVVTFPYPDRDARESLWRRAFPDAAAVAWRRPVRPGRHRHTWRWYRRRRTRRGVSRRRRWRAGDWRARCVRDQVGVGQDQQSARG